MAFFFAHKRTFAAVSCYSIPSKTSFVKEMITVISSTNRADSKSAIVAGRYTEMLKNRGAEARMFSLESLPSDFITPHMYGKKSTEFEKMINEVLPTTDKFVFVIPEYNGSYPGILKTFIDAAHPRYFKGKKAGIIGISDGHAGNLRGQEHLTGVLHYMRMMVHYAQPKLSDIDHAINSNSEITDERTLRLLSDHADLMIAF
jgi:chromate reductase, NAD(P)H dehydrogenase (quinone)